MIYLNWLICCLIFQSSARLQQGSNAAATRIYKQLKQEEYYCDHEAMVNLNKQVAVEVQNGGGQKPHPNTRPTSAVVHMNY